MSGPTVADELAWGALDEETRAQYRRIMYEELYAEVKYDIESDFDYSIAEEAEDLRGDINELRDALKAIMRGAEDALGDTSR